jgi:Ubiquitin fusion degradation protein UFD1/UBX domain
MDFDFATKRLQRDQQRHQQRTNYKKQSLTLNQHAQIQRNKLHQQNILQERQRKVEQQKLLTTFIEGWDRRLNVQSLSASPKQHLELTATSIYGEGDKITLPPAVLERLMDRMLQEDAQPWTFRIGIVNPNYVFPSSSVLLSLPLLNADSADNLDDDDDDGSEEILNANAYLDELRHKYISYTHGTVIEFTQDEGYVGIPESMANVLLHSSVSPDTGTKVVPRTRTVDAASVMHSMEAAEYMDRTDDDDAVHMEVDDADKTPGHIAWGAFDVPATSIEISMVRLPKGKSVILRPTLSAIQMGFYNLKDIKFVLEQSLLRTRATLTVGDTIHTWHRGRKFDLTVQRVTPSTFDAISCINTDLEIEFDSAVSGQAEDNLGVLDEDVTPSSISQAAAGRRLNEVSVISPSKATVSSTTIVSNREELLSHLLPEPLKDQQENVITIQFRYRDRKEQRRYDTQVATIQDVLDFVRVVFGDDESIANLNQNIQLVQRYPRRVYTLLESSLTLTNVGMLAGSEVLFVETI